MEKKKQRSGRLRLINLERDGKGISKSRANETPGLKKFFATLFNNFGKLVYVNIFMVLGNFPLLFLIINLSGYFKNPYYIPFSDFFQNISGIFSAEQGLSPYKMTLYALEGLQHQSLAPTATTYVFYGLSALTLITFGLVNVGTAYIVRNIVKGDPVFPFQDFVYAIKRNWRQALPFGALDAGIIALLTWNLYSMITTTSNFFASMLFWSNVVLFILYFFMRYYIYVQMVTFKLTVFKIIKNSLILSLLGVGRNFIALFGILLTVFFEILFLFGLGGVLMPFAVAAPLAILFAFSSYTKVYAAYPKIKQYMIDPYLDEHPEEREEIRDDDAIMKDDVTERERLEEIKKKNGILQ